MKKILVLVLSCIILGTFSCDKDRFARDLLLLLDHLPSDFHLNSDPFPEQHQGLYGVWAINSISNLYSSTDPDSQFNYLLLKPNGIFGLVADNEIVASGQLRILDEIEGRIIVEFILEPGTLSRENLTPLFENNYRLTYDDQEMVFARFNIFHPYFYDLRKIY